MPIILGTYPLTVNGGDQEWVCGPIFYPNEPVRVQASGTIDWGILNGTPTYPSSPASFSIPEPPTPQVVTFTLPEGEWSSATWRMTGNQGNTVPPAITTGSGNTENIPASPGVGTYDTGQFAVTTAQLADINALSMAGGGSFTASVECLADRWTASLFTLSLVGVTEQAFPEGSYPPFFQPHAYDPTSVLQNADWEGSALVVTNTVPVSLAAIVLPDGVTPSFGAGYLHGLRPNQDTTFQPADLKAAGATIPDQLYRIWFIFNGGYLDFSNYSGSFALTVTVYQGAAMSVTLQPLIAPQHGIESTYGVKVACTRLINSVEAGEYSAKPEQTRKKSGTQGYKFSTHDTLIREESKFTLKARLDYQNTFWFLASGQGTYSVTAYAPLGTPISGVYQHVCQPSLTTEDTFQSYTVELVFDDGTTKVVTGVVYAGLNIDSAAGKDGSISATGFGKAIQDVQPNSSPWTKSSGQNDVQVATINGGPTSLNLQFGYKGQWTTVLAWTSSYAASALQTAIQLLSTVGSGNLLVTGSMGGPYTFTGAGALAGIALEDIEVIYNTPVGGTSPTATMAHTTVGGMKTVLGEEVAAGEIAVTFASSLSGLDAAPTTIVEEYTTAIKFPERVMQYYRQNASDLGGAANIKEKKPGDNELSAELCMAWDATVAAQFLALSKGASTANGVYMRVKWTSPLQIASSGVNSMLWVDLYGTVKWDDVKASDGEIVSVDVTVEGKIDLAHNFAYRIVGVNGVTAYNTN